MCFAGELAVESSSARPGVFSDRLDLGRQDEFNVEQLFPSSPRFSQLFFTTLGPDGGSYDGDENALSTAIFDEVWQVAQQVKLCGRALRFSSNYSLVRVRNSRHGLHSLFSTS